MRVTARDAGQYSIGCSSFSRALVVHAKAVPGIRWDAPTREWWGYADAIAACVARLRHAGLRLDSSALPDIAGWRTARSPYLFATKGLRDYQVEGVRFLITHADEGALLADGMRLGKTCQALTAARAFKQKTLVVCPSHVVGVWGRPPEDPTGPGEIARWWPDAWLSAALRGEAAGEDTPGVLTLEGVRTVPKLKTDGSNAKAVAKAQAADAAIMAALSGAMVVVCSYDILYAWVPALKDWAFRTFVLDECHAAANHKSRRSDAIAELAGAAKRRIYLSGTPMTSRPRDLHNVLDTLCPGRFGYFFTHTKRDGTTSGSFSRLYCAAHEKTVGHGPEAKTVWDFSGASNLSEAQIVPPALVPEESLHARLAYLMLRRVKSEVDAQLPPKTRQVIDVKIPPSKMVSVSGAMLTDRGSLRRALDLSADGKLKSVVSLVATHAEEGEKVICFCYRRLFAEQVAKDLGKKGIFTAVVHGGHPQHKRDERIQALRTRKGPGVLCCTIDTTSTGIDLSFSAVAVFGELSWEPHELAQAEERVYRFGAGVSPLVQYVIAKGTGDELIVRGVISKLDDFEAAIGKTGDRMREDLADGVRGEAALRRLGAALAAMQAEAPPKAKRRQARRAQAPGS